MSFSIIVSLPSPIITNLVSVQERRAIFRADKGLSQSVITGITTLFEYGLTTGGPGVMSISWIIVSIMTLFVGLGMAEVVGHQP